MSAHIYAVWSPLTRLERAIAEVTAPWHGGHRIGIAKVVITTA
jgi:hypothetical protein